MLTLLSREAQAELERLIDERVAAKLAQSGNDTKGGTPWFTVTEAADYLRTSPAAIYKRMERGQLQGEHPEGSRILIHRDQLDRGTR